MSELTDAELVARLRWWIDLENHDYRPDHVSHCTTCAYIHDLTAAIDRIERDRAMTATAPPEPRKDAGP